MPTHFASTPAFAAAASSGTPPCRPKFMPADAMPEKSATIMPFLKSNSATAFFFDSSSSSPSLSLPANPTRTMPRSETTTETNVTIAEVSLKRSPAWPVTIGGMSVPVAEQSPQPIARPSPMPR